MSVSFRALLGLSLAAVLFTACQSDEPAATPQPLQLKLSVVTTGTEAYDNTKVFTAGSTNARVRLETVQFYLSDFKIVKSSGDTVKLPNRYILYKAQLDGNGKTFQIDSLPVGDYKALVYTVGIGVPQNTQSGTNPANPNNFAAGHPLNQAIAPVAGAQGMYWSWNSGYIFQKLEGLVDTSAANNGGALTAAGGKIAPLTLHIGLNGNQKVIAINRVFTVSRETVPLSLTLDLSKLLADIDLKTDRETHSFGGGATLAQKIVVNSGTALLAN